MPINKTSPTCFTTGTLIADTILTTQGSSDSISTLTKVNGVPVSAALELQSTLGGLLLPRMTTVQRNLLTATNGMMIHNTTTNALNYFTGGIWTVDAGGSVTSVDATSTTSGLSVIGGPITTTGTFSFSLSTNLQSLSDLISMGFISKTGGGYVTRSIATASSSRITLSNADGAAGNPTLDLATTAVGVGSYTNSSLTVDTYGRLTSASSGPAPVLISGSTMTGNLILNGDPSLSLQAVTKQYADSIAAGLSARTSCRVATTIALTVTYNNGTAGVGATITNANTQAALVMDGITLSVNDRVLVKNQASTFQNGIYTVTNVGSGATNWVITRATDYDQAAANEIVEGSYAIIEEGTVNSTNMFVETGAGPFTIGTTPIIFSAFNSAANIVAGTGLTKTGNTLSITNTGVSANFYYVPNLSINAQGQITTATSATRILDTGFASGNFFAGSGSGNLTFTSAQFNTGVGINSLHGITTGIQNSFFGQDSGIALTTGDFNSGFGELCLSSITTSNDCTAMGYNAASALTTGSGVVAVGSNAMSANTDGINVFAIGNNTVVGGALTNAGTLGYNTTISRSNAINLGNGCYVGINQAAPEYSLDIQNISNICSTKMAIAAVVPASPVVGYVTYTYNAQTVNTTDLALTLFTIGTNRSATVEVTINGATTTLSDFTGGNGVACVMRAAGSVSLIGSTFNKIVSTTGDFGISVTGTDTVVLNATGIGASTYDWTIMVKYQIF